MGINLGMWRVQYRLFGPTEKPAVQDVATPEIIATSTRRIRQRALQGLYASQVS